MGRTQAEITMIVIKFLFIPSYTCVASGDCRPLPEKDTNVIHMLLTCNKTSNIA